MSPRRRPETSLAYRQLWEDFWQSAEWAELPSGPPSARLLLLFLAIGPIQRAVPGVLLTGAGELGDRLGWSSADVQACLQQLEAGGAIRMDLDSRLIWLPWKYHHESPANPDIVRGSTWRAVFERWPRGRLADEVHAFLRRELGARGEAFIAAFESLPRPSMPPHGRGTASRDTVSPHPRGPSTNQRINESKLNSCAGEKAAAADSLPPDLFGGPSTPLTPSVARSDAKKKASPEEREERRQLREHWDTGFRRRCPNVEPLDWGADGGGRHRLVIGLLRACAGLGAAQAHLDRYFARFDANPFWREKGLSFSEAASSACVEALGSAQRSEWPGRRHPARSGYAIPAANDPEVIAAEAERDERERHELQERLKAQGANP